MPTPTPPPAPSRCRGRIRRGAPYTRRRLVLVALLTAITIAASTAAGLATRAPSGEAATPVSHADRQASVATTAPPAPTTAPTTTATTTTTDPETLTEPLRLGSSGDAVRRLQDRLRALGFEPGPSDGRFGTLTKMAVWAFQKLVVGTPAAQASGIVDDALWQRIETQPPMRPRRSYAAGQTTRDHTEVYLPEQVVAFFDDDRAVLISHMSSGSGQRWHQTVTIDPGEYLNETGPSPIQIALTGRSITPGGVYVYDRLVDGRRRAALGALYDPAHFNHGIAVHGADDIPLTPASHGCIRIPLYISTRFHKFIGRGDQVWVWDGRHQPEWLGQVPPPADQIDSQ